MNKARMATWCMPDPWLRPASGAIKRGLAIFLRLATFLWPHFFAPSPQFNRCEKILQHGRDLDEIHFENFEKLVFLPQSKHEYPKIMRKRKMG